MRRIAPEPPSAARSRAGHLSVRELGREGWKSVRAICAADSLNTRTEREMCRLAAWTVDKSKVRNRPSRNELGRVLDYGIPDFHLGIIRPSVLGDKMLSEFRAIPSVHSSGIPALRRPTR